MKILSILGAILFTHSLAYTQVKSDADSKSNTSKLHIENAAKQNLFIKSDSVLLSNIDYLTDAEINNYIKLPKEKLPELTDKIIEKKIKEIPTTLNIRFTPEVGVLVRNYLYNNRSLIVSLLTKAEYYFPIFEAELDKRAMPLELKYLAVVESHLNPRAVSPQGATGLWQFMYATAKYKGMNMTSLEDERRDPLTSTEYAADYLNQLHSIYGDWLLAMSAYNAGAGNINKAVRAANGVQNYWIARNHMPYETQQYVPKIIAVMFAMYYADEFFLFPSKPDYHFLEVSRVKIFDKLTLKYGAELLNLEEDELSALNPILSKKLIPKCDTGYCLIIPRERLFMFEENKGFFFNDPYLVNENKELEDRVVANTTSSSSNSGSSSSSYKTYTVKSGDNLGLIAQKYGVGVSDLKKWNGLSSSTIAIGKKLKIYTKNNVVAETPKPTVSSSNTSNSSSSTNLITYTVKSGDNLGLIAQKYGVGVSDLKNWNGLTSSVLAIGAKLKIYSDNDVVAETTKPIVSSSNSSNSTSSSSSNYKTYTVKSGDNLGFIAQKFGVGVSELKKWNNLSSSSLAIGVKLKIYSANTVVAEVAKPSTAVSEPKSSEVGFKSSEIDTKSCSCYKHEIVSGDNLWTISEKYKSDIEKIKIANNIPKGWVLKVGTFLKIPKS